MIRWLLVLFCLVRCVSGESLLDQLLQMQRRNYPQAVITSGFWDPRGVSRYRSQPGVHWGYDIAMPAGCQALAAWPGRVKAIIPWADGEWGVAVEHSDGTTATYGHLVPCVRPGEALLPGQPVGSIAVDHLDVKMRDRLGLPLDFGNQGARAGFSVPAALAPPPPARALQLQAVVRQQLARSKEGERFASGQRRMLPRDCRELLELSQLAQRSRGQWKLNWTPSDRQAVDRLRLELEALEERFELGLVSLKLLEQERRYFQLCNGLMKNAAEDASTRS